MKRNQKSFWAVAAVFGLAATFVFGAASDAAADDVRVGIIGADTEHATAFARLMNVSKDPDVAGFRVTHAYRWGSTDIAECTNRIAVLVPQLEAAGVKMVDSISELLRNVDCVLLETCDGRPHLKQALEVFASRKPCYIDKPLAGDLRDSLAILAAAKKASLPVFSASSLRYTAAVRAAAAGTYGKVRTADVNTPGHCEPTHSRYYWYAIHGADPLFAIMGTGCRDVTCVTNGDTDLLVGRWADGRVGTVRVWGNNGCYGGTVANEQNKRFDLGGYEGYKVLLVEILKFFRTGVSPIPADELDEVYSFLDAARLSYERGGTTVTLDEARARAAK